MIRPTNEWGQRALDYTSGLLEAAPVRGSATLMEARAAAHIQDQLARLGVADIRTQSFTGSRSIYLFLALAFGAAILGHAAYWLLRRPFGTVAGLAISLACFGLAAFLVWRRFTFKEVPLEKALPRGPSQNLLAVLPPEGEVRRKVVLVAHVDSHRAVWWFATDLLARIYARLNPVGIYGLLLAPLLYLAASIFQAPLIAWIGLLLAGVHFLAWFTGVTADVGVYSPGANDNAAAVGTALALVERLKSEPVQHTEIWLAFTGCEETGCEGMRHLLDGYGPALSEALFVDLELVGIGDSLVYLASEGFIRVRRLPAELAPLIAQLQLEFGVEPVHGRRFGVFTETGVIWERGLAGICFLALEDETGVLPQWHRLTDTLERLQPESLLRIHQLVWRILKYQDRQGDSSDQVVQPTGS